VRVKALLSAFEEAEGAPGEVLDDRLLVATGAGRGAAAAGAARGPRAAGRRAFLNGTPVAAGTRLG
jgi:methionyl-tRNA formyltransferase